jgi:hypothetical protein
MVLFCVEDAPLGGSVAKGIFLGGGHRPEGAKKKSIPTEWLSYS